MLKKIVTLAMVIVVSILSPLANFAVQAEEVFGTTYKNVEIPGFNGQNATDKDGQKLPTDDPNQWHEGKPTEIHYNWCMDDDVVINAGDTTTVTMPPNSALDQDIEYDIVNGEGVVVGHFSGKAGESSGTIVWNDYFEEHIKERCGELSLVVHGEKPNPNHASHIAKNGWVYGGKDEQGRYHQIMWNLLINPESRVLDNVVVTDTLREPDLHSIDADSFSLIYKDGGIDQEIVPSDSYTLSLNPEQTTFTITFSGPLERPVQVLYTSTLKEGIDYLVSGTPTDFRNDVQLTGSENGVEINQTAFKDVILGGEGTGSGELAGKIEVIKHDANDENKLLAGAEFDVLDSEGNVVDHIVVGEGGHGFSTDSFKGGEYELIETKAPDGYEIDPTPIPVTVIGNETTTIVVYVGNVKAYGSIEVVKHDSEDFDKLLSGAEFDVLDSEGNVVDHIVVGEDGHGTTSRVLDFGDYTLVETKAPEGYELDPTPIPVTLVEGEEINNVTTVDVENTQIPVEPIDPSLPGKGTIKVIKHDSEDFDKLLSGAEFDVLDSEGNVVDHIVVGEDGQGTTTIPLDFGDYTLVETKAPDGYELDSTPIPVSVVEGEKTNVITVDITNSLLPGEPIIPELPGKGTIEVIKHDSDDFDKLLSGAEFDVLDLEGNIVDHIVVGEDGQGTTTVPLDFGDYTLVETKAPDGYELDSTPIPVSVVEGNETNVTIVDVLNKRLPEKPTDPVDPGKPWKPIDPIDPGKPWKPGKPTDPIDPGKPSIPNKPNPEILPQTSEDDSSYLTLIGGGLLICLAWLQVRRFN